MPAAKVLLLQLGILDFSNCTKKLMHANKKVLDIN